MKPLPEDVAHFFKSPSSADQPAILDDSDVVLLYAQETGTTHNSGNIYIFFRLKDWTNEILK